MSNKTRCLLTEDHFRELVKGNIITINNNNIEVKIALQDIGYDNMIMAILQEQTKPISRINP